MFCSWKETPSAVSKKLDIVCQVLMGLTSDLYMIQESLNRIR